MFNKITCPYFLNDDTLSLLLFDLYLCLYNCYWSIIIFDHNSNTRICDYKTKPRGRIFFS